MIQTPHRADPLRTSTGVRGLDDLLDGGFPSNRAMLVRGGPGSGKTLFGLQFLAEGLEHDEPGVFVSVDQKPQHVIEDAAAFGWTLQPAVDGGALRVLDASAYFTATRRRGWKHAGVDARTIVTDLVQRVRENGAKRLVIDSLTSLVPLDMTRAQAHDHLRSLFQSLEDNLGCTILLTWRGSRQRDPLGASEAADYLASGIIELRLGRDPLRSNRALVRTLVVRKMRGTAIDLAEHRFAIKAGFGLLLPGPSGVVDAPRDLHAAGA